MKRLFVFASLLALAACGSGGTGQDLNGDGIDDPANPLVPDSVTTVTPSSPKGRVSGRVTDMKGAPLAGAEVVVSSTDPTVSTAITDALGLFFVDKLTGGSTVGVFVKMAGFAPAWTTALVPGATGNFPLNDGEIFVGTLALLPVSDDAVTFNVLGYDGAPIDGTATLVVTPGFVLNSGKNEGMGSISVSGTVTAGVLTFSGVPKPQEAAWMSTAGIDVRYTVYVNPLVDATGAGYGGLIFPVLAKDLLTDPWNRTLVLPAPTGNEALAILATNVQNLRSSTPSPARDNLIAKSETIYVVFNQPIADDLFVEIRNDEGALKDSVAIPINLPVKNALGTELQITARAPGFTDGQKYNLVIQASPRFNPAGGIVTFSGPFFGGDATAPKQLQAPTVSVQERALTHNGVWDLTETLEIVFDKYIGRGDSTPLTLPVFFENDLNNNGEIGDAPGELGSNQPICITDSESVPSWLTGAKESGYSKRFAIAGSQIIGYITPVDISSLSTNVVFSESFKCPGGGLHSVWGEVLTAPFNGLQATSMPPLGP